MTRKTKFIFILLAIIIIIATVLICKKQDNRETEKSGGSIFQILDIGEKEEKGEIKKEKEIIVGSDDEVIIIEGKDEIIVGE